MFGGSGPHTKRLIYPRGPDSGPKAPIRPSVKAPVRKLSSVVPEAVDTGLPTVDAARLPGPVAIGGIESPRAPVPQWIPGLPTHPHPADLLGESSFAPCQPRRKSPSWPLKR